MHTLQRNPFRFIPLLLSLLWTPVEAGEFDGFWRTQGYGAVVHVSGDNAVIYQETGASFFPVEEVQLQGNRVNLGLPPNEEIYELHFEGDTLVAVHRTSTLYLDRIESLPPVRGTSPDPMNVFDVYWTTIYENFPSFPLLDLDWQQVRQEFQPRVTASMSPAALFDVLGDMGSLLQDGHTTLYAPEFNWFRNMGPAPSPLGGHLADDVIANVESNFVDGGRFSEIPLDDRFLYGTINNGAVGYIAILDYEYRVVPFDQSLDAVLASMGNTQALIIDLRDNDGGDNWNAMALTDRLTDRERHVLTRVVRTGGPDEFGAPTEYVTRPQGTRYTDRPVYLLTNDGTASAGEVQSLMLSALPGVTQVGEPTFGMFSQFTRGLPNGWIMNTSNERFLSLGGNNYEYQGIRPEIAVENTIAALNAGEDLILEAALHDFSQRIPVQDSRVPVTAAMSGSWFAPDHDGEGFLLEILDDERALVYWFTY
ncbi:MAG: S41 family peptidase, partial [Xanthomonadales bacterium]|nr:S41 family peptidase [Xanthomonadales bacterium]